MIQPEKKKPELPAALPENHPLAMGAVPAYLREPSPVKALASDALPWIGHATRKTGSSGGSIDTAALKAAGVGVEGDPYLMREGVPYPLAGVPVALLDMQLVAQERDEATFAVTNEWPADELPTEDDGLRYVVRAALLVPASADGSRPATVAMYSDDLAAAVGYKSRVIGVLRDAIAGAQADGWAAKNPTAAKLPPALRVVGYLTGTMATSTKGRQYVKRGISCKTPDLEAVAGLMAAAQECDDEITRACDLIHSIGQAPAATPTTTEDEPPI